MVKIRLAAGVLAQIASLTAVTILGAVFSPK